MRAQSLILIHIRKHHSFHTVQFDMNNLILVTIALVVTPSTPFRSNPPGVNPEQYERYRTTTEERQKLLHQGPVDPKPPQPHSSVLHKDVKHEAGHVKEHMDVPLDTEGMSDQELQFHYFKMHDTDANNKLDGSELVKSIIHWHDESKHDDEDQSHDDKIFSDRELSELIDPILEADDRNKDGYIDYTEFILAQIAMEEMDRTSSQPP